MKRQSGIEQSYIRKDKNPFIFHNIIKNHEKFIGRKEEIKSILNSIGNNLGTIIYGKKRRGKSSLLHQIYNIISGNHTLLEEFNIKKEIKNTSQFYYVPIYYTCIGAIKSLEDLVSEIAYSINEGEYSVMNLRINFANLSLQLQHRELTPREAFEKLVVDILEYYGKTTNGIIFFLDEYDKLSIDMKFGELIRYIIEKYNNVYFIIALSIERYDKIHIEHESFRDVFNKVKVDRMNSEEMMKILNIYLNYCTKKMKNRAKNKIINISDNIPYYLQKIAYESYEKNEDNNIDISDVDRALDLLYQFAGREYEIFNRLSAASRDILVSLSKDSKPITVNGIHHLTDNKYKLQKINGIIGDLLDRKLIRKDGVRVFIDDPIFRHYIRESNK